MLDHGKEKTKIRDELHTEQHERQKVILSIEKILKESQTCGLRLSAVGLIWLVFGLVLSSASPDLAKLIHDEPVKCEYYSRFPCLNREESSWLLYQNFLVSSFTRTQSVPYCI